MAERAPNYAIVLIVMVVACTAAYWARERPSEVLHSPDLVSFPASIGQWVGEDMAVEGEVRKALNADDVLSRAYTHSYYGTPAGLLVVYRKYGRRDFIHRPELCYPAAGWTVTEIGTTSVPFAGKNIKATKVITEKSGAREIVVYWFASGERTESDFMRQQFWMALDRFQTRKYGWAFVRINCPVISSDDETIESIRAFARASSDPLVKSLTVTEGAPRKLKRPSAKT